MAGGKAKGATAPCENFVGNFGSFPLLSENLKFELILSSISLLIDS